MKITVLRLGHRISRDKRISTHVCLVSRAFGADSVVYTGEKDSGMEESVSRVVEQWGGKFPVSYEKSWRSFVKGWKGIVVHLTIYGKPMQEKIKDIEKSGKDVLVVVGGGKVPAEMYDLADYNVSVTGQPHSEIAALSILLDRLFGGGELMKRFPGWKRKVVPQEKGKKTVEK